MERRKLLSFLTAAGMVSIAGCSNTEPETTNPEDEEGNEVEEEPKSQDRGVDQDDLPPKPPDGIGTPDNATQNESSGD